MISEIGSVNGCEFIGLYNRTLFMDLQGCEKKRESGASSQLHRLWIATRSSVCALLAILMGFRIETISSSSSRCRRACGVIASDAAAYRDGRDSSPPVDGRTLTPFGAALYFDVNVVVLSCGSVLPVSVLDHSHYSLVHTAL